MWTLINTIKTLRRWYWTISARHWTLHHHMWLIIIIIIRYRHSAYYYFIHPFIPYYVSYVFACVVCCHLPFACLSCCATWYHCTRASFVHSCHSSSCICISAHRSIHLIDASSKPSCLVVFSSKHGFADMQSISWWWSCYRDPHVMPRGMPCVREDDINVINGRRNTNRILTIRIEQL